MGCLHSKTTHLPSPDDPSSQLDPGLRSPSLFLSLLHARTHTPTLHVFLFLFRVLKLLRSSCLFAFISFLFLFFLGFEANGLQDGFLLSHTFDSADFYGVLFVCLFFDFEASRQAAIFFFFLLTLRLISDSFFWLGFWSFWDQPAVVFSLYDIETMMGLFFSFSFLGFWSLWERRFPCFLTYMTFEYWWVLFDFRGFWS